MIRGVEHNSRVKRRLKATDPQQKPIVWNAQWIGELDQLSLYSIYGMVVVRESDWPKAALVTWLGG
jgi:hypothetical protein